MLERGPIGRRLSSATRMILRNIERQPFRAVASLAGIALATAILVVGLFFIDAMDVLKECNSLRSAAGHDGQLRRAGSARVSDCARCPA
jgi:hypothetical protein